MWLFRRKKPVVEAPPSKFSRVVSAFSAVFEQISSFLIPIGILTYVSPQKSVDFVTTTAQSKWDEVQALVESFNIESVKTAILDVYEHLAPMIQTEYEIIEQTVDQVPYYYNFSYFYLSALPLEYIGAIVAVLVIVALLIPWRRMANWAADTTWKTVLLLTSVLPLEDGFDTLNDKDAGSYQIMIVATSIITGLVLNYAVLFAIWWSIRFVLKSIAKFIWSRLPSVSFRKKKVEKIEEVVQVEEVEEAQKEEPDTLEPVEAVETPLLETNESELILVQEVAVPSEEDKKNQ